MGLIKAFKILQFKNMENNKIKGRHKIIQKKEKLLESYYS